MNKLFGTDGMRGEAGRFPLDTATIETVGRSLAEQFKEKSSGKMPQFIIGRDTRESGEAIERAFTAGAAASGARVTSAGVVTTPGVAFLTRALAADAGIVVSASHNPYQDNGIKIFSPSGRKIDEATERQIEADISNFKFQISNFQSGENASIPDNSIFNVDNTVEQKELQEKYLQYLVGEFAELSLDGLKMIVDCANGAAYRLAPELFFRLGANVVAVNNFPTGRNINENCGSLHLETLQSKVTEEKADFGVAFDGDADRALFVNERGEIVDGDATLWAMAGFLQQKNELVDNRVIATVMSNLGLEVALKTKNITLVRTKVGDKYVLEELLKSGASIGGEQSGHIIFPRQSLVGDGLLTALMLLAAVRGQGAKLSDLIIGFARFPQILVNVKVRERVPFEDVPEIARAAQAVESEMGERGRLVLRYSGTELLARVMIEGERQETIEEQANRLASVIRQELGA